MTVLFLGHGDALEHEHNGTAGGTDVDGLIRGIEHEHGSVQSVAIAVLMSGHQHGRRNYGVSADSDRIVKLS